MSVPDEPSLSGGRTWPLSLWLGATLAALFLYPLFAAADAQILLLHWRPRHTAELACAFGVLTAIGGVLVARTGRAASRLNTAALLALVSVPILSFALAMLRLVPAKSSLASWTSSPAIRGGIIAAGVIVVMLAVARPRIAQRTLRAAILTLSPIVIVVALAFTRLMSLSVAPAADRTVPGPPRTTAPRHVLVLLFDELSYAHLYRDRMIRPDFPALQRFAASSTTFHAATSPGEETLIALPGYFAGRRFHDTDVVGDVLQEVDRDGQRRPLELNTPDNLFARARASGFRTELYGWYLPYCRMMGSVLDACADYSLYNASSVRPRFSLFNPVRTTLILWPHQFPAGLLKNPAFSQHQRLLSAELEAHARMAFSPGQSVFRLVHFSIPHVPFVFDRNGFRPTFEPVSERVDLYEEQMQYVDTVVGRIAEDLDRRGEADRTTIVVLSDHEFRAVTPQEGWTHVPLIVRTPGGVRQDIDTPVQAEVELRSVLR